MGKVRCEACNRKVDAYEICSEGLYFMRNICSDCWYERFDQPVDDLVKEILEGK